MTDGQTDRRTDGQTDGRTDAKGVYRAALSQLKISECMLIFKIIMGFNAGSILFYNTLSLKSAMSGQLMMVASFYGAIPVKQKTI